jgi:two-component system sensor histidine kinase/response regulator
MAGTWARLAACANAKVVLIYTGLNFMPRSFTPAQIPADEAFRLESLLRLEVLDTRPEPEFDALVKVASLVCGKPISLISLVDADRQWFKADVGLGALETPRDEAFCAHAILDDQIFEVPDTLQDPRFAGNPLVENAPDIRFYAGAPITLSNGARVGTLCVIDRTPGALTALQRDVLHNLAIAAAHALEARRAFIGEQRYAAQEAQARRESHALMATIDIHTIVSEADRHGNITSCNEAFETISGYTRAELIGQNHNMVRSGTHDTAFWEKLLSTVSSGRPWRGDICNRSKSGQLYWVDSMIAPFMGDDGLVEKYVTISTDITARVNAQQQQEGLRQRFSVATESASIGIWEWNVVTNTLTWDEQMYKLYQRDHKGGDEPSAVSAGSVHPDDVASSEAGLASAVRGEKEFDQHFRIVWPNGETRHIHAQARGVRNALGTIQKLVGVNLDVTEIVRARQGLVSSKMLLEESQAIAKVGGWELNLQTGVLFWTDETYRIHEASPDTFNPTVDAGVDYFLPESRATISAALEAAMARGKGYDLELQTYTTKGNLIDVRTTCTVTMRDGKAAKLSGIFQDITERKHYERSLQEARGRAELATRSKGQFLANMSHEIRTPMNAILGMLTLLEKSSLSAQQDDYVSKTKGAAHSLLGLLNDILDLSKVEAGKMTLDLQPFRLDRMLRDLSVILSAYGGGKAVEVLYDIDPALPEVVCGDAQRLAQVLINLAGNAVKFTAQGEVIVRLQLVQDGTDTDGGLARIAFAVQDSGIGIAPENQAHIFSGFSQAEASTTRKFGGTGLGLSISQQLVGLMGGTIALSSALGHGSTFAFELMLPVMTNASDIPAELIAPASLSAAARNVLVIDDNTTACRLTAQMTQSLHWPTDTAANGAQALERIRQPHVHASRSGFPYDVVYVDWQMQGMDGWETARQVRQLSTEMGGVRPAIVMMSSHTRDSLAHRTSEEQALLDGFLVKPVTASMLQEAALGSESATSRLREARRAGSNARRLTGMRILVVEDNLINQQVAEELLASEGALVSLAANGQLGVEAVASASPQFDVVLMDVQMPVMDGYTATKTIRSHLGLSALPIVAMTANAMASDREECLAAGMTEHIGKPFDLPKLVQLLLHLTGHTGMPVASNAEGAEGVGDGPQGGEIDVRGAIIRMSGLENLYLRSAKEFMKVLTSTVEDWLAALPHNPHQAIMQMHTLKGTAALLGAKRLSQEAARLEKICHEPLTEQACVKQALPLRSVVRTTQEAMQAVIDEMSERLATSGGAAPQPGKAAGAPGGETPVLKEALHALIVLLEKSDMQALELFAQRRSDFEGAGEVQFSQLEESMQNLELEQALLVCRAMLQVAA